MKGRHLEACLICTLFYVLSGKGEHGVKPSRCVCPALGVCGNAPCLQIVIVRAVVVYKKAFFVVVRKLLQIVLFFLLFSWCVFLKYKP